MGIVTSAYAGLVGCLQHDMKRLIAFSTCSHVALMMVSLGSGAASHALYHLLVHGCAKATLFMVAGIVLHVLADDQDGRAVGCASLFASPVGCVVAMICLLSLLGIPGFSGAMTKDTVLMSL